MQPVLAVIGGSGFDDWADLAEMVLCDVQTPYGSPSDRVLRARLEQTELLFIPRHGRGHHIPPHRINYRANVCALKKLGATHVVSVSAVGSLREDIRPGDLVIVDQYVDRTHARSSTFFDEDVVAHVGLSEPCCPMLARASLDAARAVGASVHASGTYVCIEGPQFSTRAESQLYRSWHLDVIGMTALPEAKLAREAQLPYVTVATVTDYDCWHPQHDAVTVQAVLEVSRQNTSRVRQLIARLAGSLPPPEQSPASVALKDAVMTPLSNLSQRARERLDWLLPELGSAFSEKTR